MYCRYINLFCKDFCKAYSKQMWSYLQNKFKIELLDMPKWANAHCTKNAIFAFCRIHVRSWLEMGLNSCLLGGNSKHYRLHGTFYLYRSRSHRSFAAIPPFYGWWEISWKKKHLHPIVKVSSESSTRFWGQNSIRTSKIKKRHS